MSCVYNATSTKAWQFALLTCLDSGRRGLQHFVGASASSIPSASNTGCGFLQESFAKQHLPSTGASYIQCQMWLMCPRLAMYQIRCMHMRCFLQTRCTGWYDCKHEVRKGLHGSCRIVRALQIVVQSRTPFAMTGQESACTKKVVWYQYWRMRELKCLNLRASGVKAQDTSQVPLALMFTSLCARDTLVVAMPSAAPDHLNITFPALYCDGLCSRAS